MTRMPTGLRSVRELGDRVLLLAVLVALLLASSSKALCQFSGPGIVALPQANSPFPLTTDPQLLFPKAEDLRIEPGDQLSVHVFGENDFAPTGQVDTNGGFLLPYLGVKPLAGLTVGQASDLIAKGLVDVGLYRDPQVTISVVAGPSSVATMTGEMKGVVPIVGSRPLLQVLAVAGGLPTSASRVITIQRPSLDEPIIVDIGSDPLHTKGNNIPILAGDTIIVSRIGVVYMLGAFKSPGTISLNNYGPLTLTQATALSNGYMFEGKYDDLRIIRTTGGRRTVAKVDIKKVLYGQQPDPILQPNDIVFLPQSAWKASISNGTLGTALGLFSLVYSVLFTYLNR